MSSTSVLEEFENIMSTLNFNTSTAREIQRASNATQIIYHIYCYFTFCYNLPFIPFGIIFNLLSLIIFSRTPLGTTSSTRVYYLVMACTEMVIVFMKDFWFSWFGVGFIQVFGSDPLSAIRLNPHSESSFPLLCNSMIFVYFVHEMVANVTFLLFAIERVIMLYKPISARYWFNRVRSLLATGVLLLVAIATCAITFWLHTRVKLPGLVPSGGLCTQDTSNKDPIVNALASFLYLSVFILPAVLSATCSILIINKMISR